MAATWYLHLALGFIAITSEPSQTCAGFFFEADGKHTHELCVRRIRVLTVANMAALRN
jgi:hypothetical protein